MAVKLSIRRLYADARRLTEKRKGRGEGVVTYVDLSRLALKKTHKNVGLFVIG